MKRSAAKNPLPIFAPPLAIASGLALAGVLAGSTPVLAQPPDRRTEIEAYSIPEVEAAWARLREEVGAREFTAPAATIARYQKFYEERGYKSAQTAISISSAIAQLCWQALDNRTRALAIYDWAIPKFGDLPRGARLQKERDLVAMNAAINSVIAAPPVALRANDFTIAASALAPLQFETPPAPESPIFPQPVVFPASKGKAKEANTPTNVFAPVSVTATASALNKTALAPVAFGVPVAAAVPRPVASVNSSSQKSAAPSAPTPVALPSPPATSAPVVATIAAPPSPTLQNAPAPVALPQTDATIGPDRPLPVAPPPMASAKLSAPPVVQVKANAPALHAPPLFSARVAAMAGLIAQWRAGQMAWEEVTAQAKITPEEAVEMLASPAIITNYSDKELRQNLLAIAKRSPELLQDRASLAPPVQIALAESDKSQGEAIYRELLKGEIPDGVWWNRLIVMTLLADHYAAVGAPEKAAQVKLEISQSTNAESWRGNATVEAARFFM